MWTSDKISFFESNYWSLKDYAVRYSENLEEVKTQRRRRFKPPFESAVDDIVEFDMALKHMDAIYRWVYMAHFIWGMSYGGIARFIPENKVLVYMRAQLGRRSLKGYLYGLYERRQK